jgi:hypothetical protein
VKRKWGGKRAGAGRYYNLWSRIYLAQRYAHLVIEFLRKGTPKPASKALSQLHGELGRKIKVGSIKRSVTIGAQWDNFIADLYAKRHNGEPLTEFEEDFLDQQGRRSLRRRQTKS